MKEIAIFILLGVNLSCTMYLMSRNQELEKQRLQAKIELTNLQIKYLRLKTAMALVGIDDFVETTPGHVEMKVTKP
jgi:hypothetical protein